MRIYTKSFPLIFTYGGIIKDKGISREKFSIKKNRKTEIYWPSKFDKTKLPGIYLQHGMNVLGIEDPRVVELAENLAHRGFSVIVPELQEVKELIFDLVTIDHIEELALELTENKNWYDGKRFGYFSVSFSGGMGLIALSRDKTAERVKSIMAVGAYADFLETYPFVFENYYKDNYGVLVLLMNFFPKVDPKLGKELKPIFYEAALDNSFHRTGVAAQAPILLQNVSKPAQDLYRKIEQSDSFRKEIEDAMKTTYSPDYAKAFSPFHQLGGIYAPISLLHGISDPVISPLESEKLARLLESRNHQYIFRKSSALTHGDQLPLYSQIQGIPALLQTFGSFLVWLQNS